MGEYVSGSAKKPKGYKGKHGKENDYEATKAQAASITKHNKRAKGTVADTRRNPATDG